MFLSSYLDFICSLPEQMQTPIQLWILSMAILVLGICINLIHLENVNEEFKKLKRG